MAAGYACSLIIARAGTNPGGETLLGGKDCCGRADFCDDLLGRVHSQIVAGLQPVGKKGPA